MKKLILVSLVLALSAVSAKAEVIPCEKSLIRFLVKGQPVASKLIGEAEPCDDFGGNLAYSPRSKRHIFVNFNIEGTIDLDEVDAAFALVPFYSPVYQWLNSVQIAVVAQSWIDKFHAGQGQAFFNMTSNVLFVSEKVVNAGRFGELMRSFYGSANQKP